MFVNSFYQRNCGPFTPLYFTGRMRFRSTGTGDVL